MQTVLFNHQSWHHLLSLLEMKYMGSTWHTESGYTGLRLINFMTFLSSSSVILKNIRNSELLICKNSEHSNVLTNCSHIVLDVFTPPNTQNTLRIHIHRILSNIKSDTLTSFKAFQSTAYSMASFSSLHSLHNCPLIWTPYSLQIKYHFLQENFYNPYKSELKG